MTIGDCCTVVGGVSMHLRYSTPVVAGMKVALLSHSSTVRVPHHRSPEHPHARFSERMDCLNETGAGGADVIHDHHRICVVDGTHAPSDVSLTARRPQAALVQAARAPADQRTPTELQPSAGVRGKDSRMVNPPPAYG